MGKQRKSYLIRFKDIVVFLITQQDMIPMSNKAYVYFANNIERRFFMQELEVILEKFAGSGWDLIAIPAKAYLNGNGRKEDLIEAIEQADKECGNCGCEFDSLYKRCIELNGLL